MAVISKLKNNQRGIALIASYLVVSVLIIFAVTFVTASLGQNKSANLFKNQLQAFDLAESGLDHALYWLRNQPSPPVGNNANLLGTQYLPDAAHPVGSYTVALIDLGAVGGNVTVRRYKIVSTGTVGGVSAVLTNFLQVDNYADYIWFTDGENFGATPVWFWNQDNLNGRVSTNTHFNIAGTPVFNGEVRSVDNYIRYYNNGNNISSSQPSNPPYDTPTFQQGITLGVDKINMPNQALNLRSASTNGGLRLTGDTTVVLNANGTMNVSNDDKNWHNKNMSLPSNGALFVDSGKLTISGTLNGRLTAGASNDLIIPGNILYNTDPRVNSNSTDMLGLISESDVMIDDNGPTNMEIDASIMALSTSFYLENWSYGSPKGTLTVFGGIIQDQRGPVGTFNGFSGQKLSGYSKSYSYDTRMVTSPPPFYPTTGDYITLAWGD